MRNQLLIVLVMMFIAIPITHSQQTTPDPAIGETVVTFFDGYLDARQPENAGSENPYQNSPHLTTAFIDKLDTAFSEALAVDPLLCAQALPEFYSIEIVDYTDDRATVLMRQHFTSPLTHNIEIDLLADDDGWKIDDVRCVDTVTPRGVVQTFYDQWLAYGQYDVETGTIENPMVDRIWRDSELVTPSLVQDLDTLMDDSDPPINHDPVLCAQDFPGYILPLEVDNQDGRARVLMNEFFGAYGVPHRVLVSLQQGNDDQWRIDAISCDVPPETIALSFYRLYIDFVRYDMNYRIERTQLVDWGFNWDTFLSDSLQNTLTEQLQSDVPLIADPVVCAQDLPAWVEVTPLTETDNAVTLQVDGMYASGPDSMTAYDLAQITMESELGRWQITDILCSATAED